ncbi:MAG: FUSC family protein [Comamonadaceae bacterium]|nr:MAG: FUSC family protein [Comamonadaceae bacterium]
MKVPLGVLPDAASIRGGLTDWRRVLLGHYFVNGVSAAFGLLLIILGTYLLFGLHVASAAAVGAIVTSPPDLPSPRKGKLLHLLPAPLLGLPLFLAVELLDGRPIALGLLLMSATFVAFLTMAWGKRGIPIAIAAMLAMIFSMAAPSQSAAVSAYDRAAYFALGAALYLAYALLANRVLNARYRMQLVADTLIALAELTRTQGRQFEAASQAGAPHGKVLAELLRQHAALADLQQGMRDIVLESPTTAPRQRLVGMLLAALELRDHLLACALDLDAVQAHRDHPRVFAEAAGVLDALADQIDALADALLLGREAPVLNSLHARLEAMQLPHVVSEEDARSLDDPHGSPSVAALVRGLADRIGLMDEEVQRLNALARREITPDLALVRTNWRLFVSPAALSWRVFLDLWVWKAPTLRHAIRGALAIGCGYAIALALPWAKHEYWILLTITVVLRGSLSQTLERRNARVAGTVLGCVLAVGLLASHPSGATMLICLVVAQAIAHGFAVRRYLITAAAASVLGLVQAHMLNVHAGPTFALFERIADTLIGAGIAWAFSYVLPSWERGQIAALVQRALTAQARHARLALSYGQAQIPELDWRLARREAYDSLSALAQATQRSLSEPRAVRPPLEPLEALQARSYQLLAQLSAVKSTLLFRRGQLPIEYIAGPLERAAASIDAALSTPLPAPSAGAAAPAPGDVDGPALPAASPGPVPLPDLMSNDLSPWLLRRLELATGIASRMREDACRVSSPAEPGAAGTSAPPPTPGSRERTSPE